jgi:hypothetical protein
MGAEMLRLKVEKAAFYNLRRSMGFKSFYVQLLSDGGVRLEHLLKGQ